MVTIGIGSQKSIWQKKKKTVEDIGYGNHSQPQIVKKVGEKNCMLKIIYWFI
jgi:hypothetical protein